jgi:cell division septal protein FtsQ
MARRPVGRPVAPGIATRPPSALRPGARSGGGARRTPKVRRRSAGLTPVRAGALLALLVALTGLYGATRSDAFTVRRTAITGAAWTPEEAVRSALAIPAGQNLFTLGTRELERRLEAMPAIRGASISVVLPDEVRVAVSERVPLLAWKVGDQRYLVDEDGFLFARVEGPVADRAEDLPVVDDRRLAGEGLTLGSTLDPVVLDAALRLGSLQPADLGTAATHLDIRVDDEDGFVMTADPVGWSATFGFYTPTLRTTELIPGQVRLLRSMLAQAGEGTVLKVILADDRSGTRIPRPSPSPTPKPTPKPSGKAAP